jgi:hypothetical protein
MQEQQFSSTDFRWNLPFSNKTSNVFGVDTDPGAELNGPQFSLLDEVLDSP